MNYKHLYFPTVNPDEQPKKVSKYGYSATAVVEEKKDDSKANKLAKATITPSDNKEANATEKTVEKETKETK